MTRARYIRRVIKLGRDGRAKKVRDRQACADIERH